MANTTPKRSGRRIALWTGAGVVVLILAAGAWIGFRGLEAKDQLTKAEPLASQIESDISAGHSAQAVTASAQLSRYAGKADSLTSDPVWRVAEFVPFVGPNLTAVRIAAEATDTVATKAIAPVTSAASGLNVTSFKPVGGVVNLKPLEKVQPALAQANAGLESAAAQLRKAPTGGMLAPVSGALTKLRSTVHNAQNVIGSVNRAAQLVPTMLGASGPRNYLLLFVNPAELRSTGGITGSLALVHTDNGAISLAAQVSGDDLGNFDSPVAPLPQVVQSLFASRPAEYIQDVNLTPDYPLSASLAAKMWTARYGTPVDGVITIDPVVLSYILQATGPIPLADGLSLTSSNAVQLLLSQAYQIFPDNTDQDAFFSATAAAVFERVSSGDVDPYQLIRALVQGGSERRINVWSAHAADQKILAGTTLQGDLPVSTAKRAALGLYFNDATGAKLDYYLHVAASTSTRVCGSAGDPDSYVTVKLTNETPADAATSLPTYVTNVGRSGVPAGTIITQVGAYGPGGGLLVSTTSAGKAVATHPEVYGGRPVSQFMVTLAPGQSQTVTIRFRDEGSTATATSLAMTPGLNSQIVAGVAPKCAAE